MVKQKLLDRVRHAIRVRHLSTRTEQAYVNWIRSFILFHNRKHPEEMDESHISQYLTYLAVKKRVASSTQNQALHALIFLYRHVLQRKVGSLDNVEKAKRPSRLPVVFTRNEVKRIMLHLQGANWLMASLLYGAGLRLMECARLRVKDVDIGYNQVTVRDGKGQKDRVTILPAAVRQPIKRHLEKVKAVHDMDLKSGYGRVDLPFSLDRKWGAE